MEQMVSSSYEHALACAYHRISKRGILVDQLKLQTLREKICKEISSLLRELTENWQVYVYCGTHKPDDSNWINFNPLVSNSFTVNINSSSGANSLLNCLKKLNYQVPPVRKKDKETGEYEWKEAADQLSLMKMFAATGDKNLQYVLRIRELAKILSTDVDAKLWHSTYYSAYNVAATVTGRRGSKKHIFGYGGNGQNFPKHSELGKEFLECLVARPGKVFLFVDQMSAEEWPVSALAGNYNAIRELSATNWPDNDRHTKLACHVFKVQITDYTKNEWKDSSSKAGIMRYLGGKKARHANNYGMRGTRMSEIFASEGFAFPPKICEDMLEQVHQFDPSVRNVFHTWVRNEITQNRFLKTPLGRERQFFGLRPNSTNYDVFNEAYAYIPQSTVGDNTGMAVLYLDSVTDSFVIQESHDSVVQELDDNLDTLDRAVDFTAQSFDREITFHNGFKIKIPIEGELGYSFGSTVKLKNFNKDSLHEAYKKLKEQTEEEKLNALCHVN